jgi:beta-galactosidase
MINMTQSSPTQKLHLGAAYYPEHWPEERWDEDIRLMQEAGLTVIRMAEFAWSTMEPEPGRFNFSWLERAIEKLAAAGIVTVLGTPSAGPPAWLVAEHPDLMAVEENGRRVQFGNRCHYCVNSAEFHAATRSIVEAMGKQFGSNPHVIGWQIDNEYERFCYCERCTGLFQQFLAQKYGTLDALNRRWATAYWSQTYSAWEQIPIPIGPHNPGLMLEFKHFLTASYRKFQRLQLDVLRPHLRPGVWTTHNFKGWFGDYDHYQMTADLGMASWDWYLERREKLSHNDYLLSGATHDLVRGFKRSHFWVTETQPGNVNWREINVSLNKGEASAMAWHAIGHGADAVVYWQWRSALGGQEQYHGTLVDPSGQPRPFYEEAQSLGRQIQSVSDLLAGSKVHAKVAILNSYDSRWSIEFERHHKDFGYVAHLNHYYRPLAVRNIGVDILAADEPLDGQRLVIAPALVILTERRVQNLARFVEEGGHLVLTVRTGMKDEFNALLPSRQPGALASLAGVEVEDYYALDEGVPVEGEWLKGSANLWAERLKILDQENVTPIAFYGKSNGWLDGQVAVAVHPYGKGMVYMVGAYLDAEAQQTFMEHVLQMAGLEGMQSPQDVEICTRIDPAGRTILIVINHARADRTLTLPYPVREQFSGQKVANELKLPAYGVAVLTKWEG